MIQIVIKPTCESDKFAAKCLAEMIVYYLENETGVKLRTSVEGYAGDDPYFETEGKIVTLTIGSVKR